MIVILLLAAGSVPLIASAQELKAFDLPRPVTEGGKPLMEALKARSSARSFSDQKLPAQVLSNLLWAAFGVNRPDSGKRTAPSAMNIREIDVYVAIAEGLYLFDAEAHKLTPVLAKDIRAMTGSQDFVKDAPLNLIYVADLSKMGKFPAEKQRYYSAANTGFISQNVYLYCASEGLGTVVRDYIDRPPLKEAMKLRPEQEIILAQTVGYLKK